MEKAKKSAFLTIILLVVLILVGVGVMAYSDYISLSRQKKIAKEISSLIHENALLREALAAKIESHCDTTTVEQKLAQQKLDDYSYRMYEIKDAQEMKARDQKESADLKLFDIYWNTQSKLLIELEKKDPKNFLDYAVISFRSEKHNGTYNLSQKMSSLKEKIEKIPSVAEFIKGDKDAWNLRTEAGKKIDQEYSKSKAEIELGYQNKLKIIGENYQKKIAAKKAELGL